MKKTWIFLPLMSFLVGCTLVPSLSSEASPSSTPISSSTTSTTTTSSLTPSSLPSSVESSVVSSSGSSSTESFSSSSASSSEVSSSSNASSQAPSSTSSSEVVSSSSNSASSIPEGPSSEVTLVANPPSGYEFWYWKDTRTNKVFSREPTVTAILPTPHPLEAVYRVVPTQWYTTTFDGTIKSGYARASATFDGKSWTLDDARTNMVSADKREGTRSVHLHGGGYFQTDFTISHLANISFKHAVYGSDVSKATTVTLGLQFSQNLHRWTTLDGAIALTASAGTEMYTYTFTFDGLGLYLEGKFNPSLPLYLRIINQNQQSSADGIRLNVDTLTLNTYATHPDYPLLPHQSNRLQFQLASTVTTVYEVGETKQIPTCLAVDSLTLNSQSCLVTETINTSQTGQYALIYSATDWLQQTIEVRYTITVIQEKDHLNVNYTGYYDGIEGLYGDALIKVLREKSLASINRKSYGDAKTSLPLADVNPNNSSQAIAIYTGNSLNSTWDGGSTWQREHVWPNSRLGVRGVDDSDLNIASDLHNLRFIEAGVNQSRSNKGYAATTTTSTYYPGQDRGDVARIYFYMAMHYDLLEIIETLPSTGEYLSFSAQSGIRSYLLVMHQEDPVSSFETARHNYIKNYQGNPNPFIDYPYLVGLAYL